VTNAALWQMSPSDIAKVVHADDKAWIARAIYPLMPAGHGVNGIELYAMPEPVAGRLCRVDALAISTGNVGEMQYRLARGGSQVYYALAKGFGGKAGMPESTALSDACHRTPIAPDIFVHAGADHVFDAPSTRTAAAAVDAVAALSDAVRPDTGVLPFDLACEGTISIRHFCADTRGALAKVLERDLENVELCPDATDTCLKLDGFYNGHDHCRLRVDFHDKDLSVVDRVQMHCEMEPFF
jgi:hypothetical protein